MNKVRILHIIDSLDIGGTETRCLEIIRGLDGETFDSHLIYFRGGALRSQLDELNLTHREIRLGRFASVRFWKGIGSIARYIRKSRIDLVQTYGFYSNVPGILAAKVAGVRAIIASRRDMGVFLSPAQRLAEKCLWHFTQYIVVNATAIKRSLLQAGVPAKKLVVIHNGIDVSAFRALSPDSSSAKPIVGMVANFRHQKDHATFLDAGALILARRPEVQLMLVGSGPLESDMRRYAAARGIDDRVYFAGQATGAAMRDVIYSLTISVLSSKNNEGLPNVVLESMAARKPVVATDVGGVHEAVSDGETGFLVPPRDPRALAEKVLWLIDHPEGARQMGLRGRQRVEQHFTLTRMEREWSNLYLEALREKGMCLPRPMATDEP